MMKVEQPISPRLEATRLSKLLFLWVFPLFWKGRKQELQIQDLDQVLPEDRSKVLGDKLDEAWSKEVYKCEEYNKHKGGKKSPSLLKALLDVFFWKWAVFGIFAFIEECVVKLSQPIFLGFLLRYFQGEYDDLHGYLFAAGVVFGSAYYTASHHPHFFEILHINMKIRVACSSLIYRKALKLSQSSLEETTIGQLVNLLSNDVARFDQSTNFIHYLWIGPVQLGIIVYILWGYFGPPCLAGVAFLILFTPFQSYMGKLFSKLRAQVAEKTDRRLRIMNEIVSGIGVIKMYAWEIPFSKLVAESRKDEIKLIRRTTTLRTINQTVYYVSSKVILFLTLLTYILTGNNLTAEKVFVTMALYNNVRLIMTLFFPLGISQVAETLVSIHRLENFLLKEDRHRIKNKITTQSDVISGNEIDNSTDNVVETELQLNKINAKWNPAAEEMTLTNVSLKTGTGQLTAIIGPVGAGKSSLLQAILNELPINSGSINIKGNIAYTSQEPWVFGGNIRDNIVFGKPFDSSWYEKVIEACALKKDLCLLPHSDKTLVGDRGISLSGGQKARINLARAVYSNADIYLLDDPLSAVDAEVGRHLFEKCIRGILKKKSCILVTHQLQFLQAADEILLLENGTVQAQGSYSEVLKKTDLNFAQLLKSKENENESEYEQQRRQSLIKFRERKLSDEAERRKASIATSLFDGGEEVVEELQSTGDIEFGLYWKYIRAGSNACTLFLFVFSNLLSQVLATGSDYWLQLWTKTEEDREVATEMPRFSPLLSNLSSQGLSLSYIPDSWYSLWSTIEDDSGMKVRGNFSILQHNINSTDANNINENEVQVMDLERDTQVLIYAAIVTFLFIATFIRTSNFFNITMQSSVILHKQLFSGVLRAPMRFFELNPIGRILNRFAKDIGTIDELLPLTLFDTLEVGLQVLGVLVIVSITNAWFLIPSVILGCLFYLIKRFYLRTARSIKRLEGIARSPVFSHLSTSLHGLTTIRAFEAEAQFQEQFDAHQDLHSSSWYLFLATARWLGVVVDWISILYIAVVTFGFMFTDQDPAIVGLAVSSAMTLTSWFQWAVRQSAESENQMVSVERILDYSRLEPEAALESTPENKPKNDWPSDGEIKIQNMFLQYGDQPPVLKDISCTIKSQEKVGIVGRTGAGKSSLITALFRLSEPSSGSIEIDGVNCLKIGLHDLRSKISIIPQDPVLFVGTVRYNLDPLSNYSDPDIWSVLQDVHLVNAVVEMPRGLDTEISEGGTNFSVGQRQLICLGRAILKKNKILVLDEATANVDPETDSFIQHTIRTKFLYCTVLTVAHRLNTVIDSDRIMVLDSGIIKEFDEPYSLLQKNESFLYQLAQQTGKINADQLVNIAKKAKETH